MAQKVVDPWLLNSDGTVDPFAANVDWGAPDLPDLDDDQPNPNDPVLVPQDGLTPEIITPEPVAPVPVPEPEAEEPETVELEDGTTLTLEKEKGQWKGTVASSTGGNPQVYWGKTKNELIFNVLKAQANATKKIREQNAKLKYGSAPVKQTPAPPANPEAHRLTADEIFEIKTKLESDPDLALNEWFQKATGVSVQQLVAWGQEGRSASLELRAESINKQFLERNPDYYGDPGYENFGNLVKWVAKFKSGKMIPQGQENQVFYEMVANGQWNLENIEEAFADLSADGIIVKAPRAPKQAPRNVDTPPPVAVPNEPAPAPRPDSRIVSTVTRPRASLGIGKTDVTPVKPADTPREPSAEDFESMTDKEVAETMAALRRYKANQNRR